MNSWDHATASEYFPPEVARMLSCGPPASRPLMIKIMIHERARPFGKLRAGCPQSQR
jgi:hypothetical protein